MAEICLPYDLRSWCFPQLSHSDVRWLNHAVAPQEINDAIFKIGSNKVVGPDGVSALFFFPKVLGHCWVFML